MLGVSESVSGRSAFLRIPFLLGVTQLQQWRLRVLRGRTLGMLAPCEGLREEGRDLLLLLLSRVVRNLFQHLRLQLLIRVTPVCTYLKDSFLNGSWRQVDLVDVLHVQVSEVLVLVLVEELAHNGPGDLLSVRFAARVVLYLHVQVQRALRPIRLPTPLVWASETLGDLVGTTSLMLLSSSGVSLNALDLVLIPSFSIFISVGGQFASQRQVFLV